MRTLKRFWNNHSGATAIEYGLIAGLIAMAILGSLTRVFGKVMASLQAAVP